MLEGVGGIGKTALGAQLAQSMRLSESRNVCWLTIRAGLNDNPTALLYAWAAFLAQHDSPQLWAFMRATANEQKRLTDYYPLLRQGLAKVQPLLCVDNLETLLPHPPRIARQRAGGRADKGGNVPKDAGHC